MEVSRQFGMCKHILRTHKVIVYYPVKAQYSYLLRDIVTKVNNKWFIVSPELTEDQSVEFINNYRDVIARLDNFHESLV